MGIMSFPFGLNKYMVFKHQRVIAATLLNLLNIRAAAFAMAYEG